MKKNEDDKENFILMFSKFETDYDFNLLENKILAEYIKDIIEMGKNIKKIEEESEQYSLEAITDNMTQLYNRKAINTIFEEKLIMSKLTNHKVSLAVFDIDHFKRINDTYGHQTGDEVLIEMSKILKNELRKDDIIMRYGGEEFVALINQDVNEGQKICERIRNVIEEKEFKTVGKITISIGLSENNKDNFKSLFKKSDEALYFSKENGRNQVTLWTKDLKVLDK